MKRILMLGLFVLLVGCDYTVPLVTTPTIGIDRSVLGLWETPGPNGTTEALLILPLDDREYLVAYPAGSKETLYARACLCRVGERVWVQLKWFGTGDGKGADDDRVFQFASYSVADDRLTVRLLNPDVVSFDVASTGELVAALTANRERPDLLKEGKVFTRRRSGEGE